MQGDVFSNLVPVIFERPDVHDVFLLVSPCDLTWQC